MPHKQIPAMPGGSNTPKVTHTGALGNTPSLPGRNIHLIESHGRDMRFCSGTSPDASNALAINPAAPPCLVYAAAMSRVADIRSLTASMGFLTDDLVESVPAHVFRDFIDAVHGIAVMAEHMFEHASILQRDADFAAGRSAHEGV